MLYCSSKNIHWYGSPIPLFGVLGWGHSSHVLPCLGPRRSVHICRRCSSRQCPFSRAQRLLEAKARDIPSRRSSRCWRTDKIAATRAVYQEFLYEYTENMNFRFVELFCLGMPLFFGGGGGLPYETSDRDLLFGNGNLTESQLSHDFI